MTVRLCSCNNLYTWQNQVERLRITSPQGSMTRLSRSIFVPPEQHSDLTGLSRRKGGIQAPLAACVSFVCETYRNQKVLIENMLSNE